MKIYDFVTDGTIVSTAFGSYINAEILSDGLANGAIVERDATYDEELTEIRRLRYMAYPSLGDQLDAYYKAERGDRADLDAILTQIDTVKAQYPKPIAP